MAQKGAESEDIVIAFQAQHRDSIAREIGDLTFIALMKLVGQVGSTRAKGASAAQLEMFGEYGVPPTILIRKSDGRRMHRHVQSMKPHEVRDYIAEHTRPRAKVSEEVAELARLLDDIEPFKKSEETTVGECWTSYRESKAL